MKLSNNFSLSELTHSDTALRLNISNIPNKEQVEWLKSTAINILQPIRNHFEISFSPTSGFRCLELNRILKSSDKSQHVKGQAVDIKVPGISTYELALWISENLDFDQCIMEFYTPGEPYSGWVHCSYVSPEENRHQVLTIGRNGTYAGLIV